MRRDLHVGVALGVLLALGATTGAVAASPASQSFTTPGEQQFVVPPGVNSVQVVAVGGNGGPGNGTVAGGSAATVTATLAVTPGQTLYAEVAGNGQGTVSGSVVEEGHGGYGGGGAGGSRFILFTGAAGGGGGGGASDVRTCPASASTANCGGQTSLASRLLVAAGGGGGGGIGEPVAEGGDGGPADHPGLSGKHDSNGDEGGSPGLRGTPSSGGAPGSPSADCSPPEGQGCAQQGQPGLGGDGGNAGGGGGGGGGGGLYGGGGGGGGMASATGSGPTLTFYNGGGGGGGGGASGVPADATGVSGFSLVPTLEGAQPSISFTWTPSAPAAVTNAPTTVTATTAVLGGTVNPSAWQVLSCAFEISPAPAGLASFPCAQQLGAGVVPIPVTATAAGLAPGTAYTVTLLAASVQGLGSGTPVSFTTPALGSTGAGTGTAPATGGAAPTVSDLKLSPARFRRGKHAARLASSKPRAKRVPLGTTISFVLSQAANVTLGFERAQAGRGVGHRCLMAGKFNPRGKHCTRYVTAPGAVTLSAHAGSNRIRFEALLAGNKPLPAGSYRLSLSASNAAGRTTATQQPRFVLLP